MSELTKYNAMEKTLQTINSRYVQLSAEEIKRNNVIMNKVISEIVGRMRRINVIFNNLYSTIFYGGSYYDGLKVGHPDEYDIDLLLVLPKTYKAEVARSTSPGFVHATLGNKEDLAFLCESGTNYLDTGKILSWIQGLLDKALIDFHYETYESVHIKTHKAGPAFTLKIRGSIDGMNVFMDIDLVTCIPFKNDSWPQGGYRQNPCWDDGSFFIVPKSPKSACYSSRYWRLSFQAQEKILIRGQKKLKPALKLLKKMRNSLEQPIDSYHLKTIVLWEVLEHPEKVSSDKSLSYVFMHILKLYKDKILQKKIDYFWNKKLNLIDDFQDSTCQNIGRYLESIIKKIDQNPLVIAKYILERDEFAKFAPQAALQAALEIEEEPKPESLERDEFAKFAPQAAQQAALGIEEEPKPERSCIIS